MIKSAENAKAFVLASAVDGHIVPVTISAIYFKPVHSIKSVFANGPPGFVAVVPLYTQFHSLRI